MTWNIFKLCPTVSFSTWWSNVGGQYRELQLRWARIVMLTVWCKNNDRFSLKFEYPLPESEHLREHSCSLPLYIRSASHGPWSAGRCCMCLRSQSLVHFTAVTIGNTITQEAVAGRVEQAAEERNQRPRKWGWDSVDRVMEGRDSLHWRKLCTALQNYKRPQLGVLQLNHCMFWFLYYRPYI